MSQTWRVCLFAAYEFELPFHKVGDTGFTPKAGHKRSPKLKSSEWRVPRAAVIMKGGESPLLLTPLPVIHILASSGPASEDCLGC